MKDLTPFLKLREAIHIELPAWFLFGSQKSPELLGPVDQYTFVCCKNILELFFFSVKELPAWFRMVWVEQHAEGPISIEVALQYAGDGNCVGWFWAMGEKLTIGQHLCNIYRFQSVLLSCLPLWSICNTDTVWVTRLKSMSWNVQLTCDHFPLFW